MSPEILFVSGLSIIILIGISIAFVVKKPKKLKTSKYQLKWNELQVRCKDKNEWPTLLIDADKLLDNALKRRKFKGGSMGERMVSAQRVFTNNDGIWFAHNLCKKIASDPDIKLRESDVKNALVSFRQALRDVRALEVPSRDMESTT